jgi:hypothetical protein
MAIQDDIDVLQAQIDAIKGDVSGVPPASCNITGLKDVITELEEQIKDLRISQVEEDNPFDGTTMTLRLDAKSMPSLAGVNQAAVALINAIGVKPAAVVMDGVTVSASGSSGITVSFVGETDAVATTEKLAAFASEKGVTIDVAQAQTLKAGNIDKAEQYLAMAQLQENIITTLIESDAQLAPLKPDIGMPDLVTEGKVVFLDVVITGMEPTTIDVDWGDGDVSNGVSFPAEHTYDEYGEYTITITATNGAGTDEKTIGVMLAAS